MIGKILARFRAPPPVETRAMGSGFTAEIMAARQAYFAGRSGLAELSGTVATCVSLWESALGLADVSGAPALDRRTMATVARSLALRGESVWLIDGERLIPVSDWEVRTRDGEPVAYRVSVPDTGGGASRIALAGEVLHVVIGADPATPWRGSSPLRRASLSAGLLEAIETSLAEVYENAPIASSVLPFPESTPEALERLGASFRGRRGRVLLRESVHVSAAGGPAPSADWKPAGMTPSVEGVMPDRLWDRARASVLASYGVLPSLLADQTQGPLVREAQRHLASWVLQPVAAVIAEEASRKLGGEVFLDVLRPLQAWDSGGRARSFAVLVEAVAKAKESGLASAEVERLLALVNWAEGDRVA